MAEPSSRSSATVSLPGRSPRTAATQLLTCDAVATEAERRAHFRIRHRVFVIEQGMFGGSYGGAGGAGDDADVHDDDPATIHVIGRADETICGTVRLYPLGPDAGPDTGGRWKGDRLAVLASYLHPARQHRLLPLAGLAADRGPGGLRRPPAPAHAHRPDQPDLTSQT